MQTLDWYLQHLGLIVSDFLYYPGQRERGPVMSFIRCDRGVDPDRPPHAGDGAGTGQPLRALRLPGVDLDALAAGGEYLREQGYQRSWGIGRHIQGSQIFDYWRDPDGFLVEHFSDGDLFDCTLEPGWAPMTASGLAQWGPPATKDFLGITPGRESLQELRAIARALRERQRVRPAPPARPAEGGDVMSISVLRTADAWYVQTPTGAARIDTDATTTAELLADREAITAAAAGTDRVPVEQPRPGLPGHRALPGGGADDQLRLPRHRRRHEPEHDPADVLPQGVRARSAARTTTSCGPRHVRLLDYEVEIGLVIGRAVPVGTDDHRGQPRRLRRGPGGHQRRVRPRRAAAPDPVLRGQVLPDASPPSGPRWCCWTPTSSSGSPTCGCGCGSTASCARTPASAPT